MKKDWYWPAGIITSLLLFIAGLVAFYLYARTIPLNLVDEDYYERGITYQLHINRLQRTAERFGDVRWSYHPDRQIVYLRFPLSLSGSAFEGYIRFFRPSDASQDFAIPLRLDKNAAQLIPVGDMTKGLWRVQIFWLIDGVDYFKEEMLVIE